MSFKMYQDRYAGTVKELTAQVSALRPLDCSDDDRAALICLLRTMVELVETGGQAAAVFTKAENANMAPAHKAGRAKGTVSGIDLGPQTDVAGDQPTQF